MNSSSKAILLVADISGYTRFMRLHAVSTSHAKQIIVTLLKSLMKASRPPLRVAELEGDAVFFYALSSGGDVRRTAEQVKDQIVQFFAAFNDEISRLSQMKTCVCEACTNVADLKLKQVIHLGDVAIEKIEKFVKLFGMDVIVVHRMLKNSVPSNEYVMMTDRLYNNLSGFYGLDPERRKESFEGVGEVETLVFYPSHLRQAANEPKNGDSRPSLQARAGWWLNTTWRTLFDLLGLRKIKGAFNNLPS